MMEPARTQPSHELDHPCPHCGNRMLIIETFEPDQRPHRPSAPTLTNRSPPHDAAPSPTSRAFAAGHGRSLRERTLLHLLAFVHKAAGRNLAVIQRGPSPVL